MIVTCLLILVKCIPKTRVILDGTEIPIQNPKASLLQRATFYEKNTFKVIVGYTPRGAMLTGKCFRQTNRPNSGLT